MWQCLWFITPISLWFISSFTMVYECLWYNLSFHGALWKPPFTSLGPVSGLNSVDLFMAMFQVSFSICPSIFFWLVVTGTMEFWMTFHILGIVTPTDELIFFSRWLLHHQPAKNVCFQRNDSSSESSNSRGTAVKSWGVPQLLDFWSFWECLDNMACFPIPWWSLIHFHRNI